MSGPTNTAHSGNVEQYYHNVLSIITITQAL